MPENIVNKRKTFAIISHPDAGKTTLTEKLLLFGGAIQQAGAVKARGENRRAHSDWMKVEQERGISVASSVMTFEYENITFNLLDTPGHEDFSEDTYRVLTAVDSAVMVLDSAKGIETQTKKLFEVCRLRNIPILTFINKLDREGQDPLALLDEIESTLALDVTPASWPVGSGKDFKGVYDREAHTVTVSTVTVGDITLTTDDYTVIAATGTNVGEYIATVLVNSPNFDAADATATMKIVPYEGTMTVELAEDSVVYDREAHEVVVSAVTVGEFTLNADEYTYEEDDEEED